MKMGLRIQKQVKNGRLASVRPSSAARGRPPGVRGAATLAELQAQPEFHDWIALVSESPYEEVCPKTLAYCVVALRLKFPERDITSEVLAFAATGAPEPEEKEGDVFHDALGSDDDADVEMGEPPGP
eukprot:TRINITY_DN16327_c0_g1_i1.p5 TRINITY_DN16327_c0_g1~~TRINITY_DN16327_c0_g1_i1.p5  ORF type:complete len:127 (-),score=47.17 TRINITY_DN16327_c0_g1_i1:163-543(-)